MISHHEKIQRSRKLGALPARGYDLLAFCETISILRAEPRAECTRVHRIRCVKVRVAEVRPGWKVAPRIGRVRRLRGKHFLGCCLVERPDVCGYVFCRGGRGEQTCCERAGEHASGDREQTDHTRSSRWFQ